MSKELKKEVEQEVEVVEIKKDTTNPFNKGVTYEEFLSNVTKEKSEDKLIKDLKLDIDSENWLRSELENYKQTKTKK